MKSAHLGIYATKMSFVIPEDRGEINVSVLIHMLLDPMTYTVVQTRELLEVLASGWGLLSG